MNQLSIFDQINEPGRPVKPLTPKDYNLYKNSGCSNRKNISSDAPVESRENLSITGMEDLRESILATAGKGTFLKVYGRFIEVLYNDSSNMYTVASLKAYRAVICDKEYECSENICVQGYFDYNPSMECKIEGTVVEYRSKYNGSVSLQLKVKGLEYEQPATIEGIITFLSGGIKRGVGLSTANKIVLGSTDSKGNFHPGFGEQTLDIIANDYMKLTRIPTIGRKTAEKVYTFYMDNCEYQNVIFFLQQFNTAKEKVMTPAAIAKIYREYGTETIDIISKNPYRLGVIKGFGFKSCDRIALKLGLDPHGTNRIKEALIYSLQNATEEGHCFLYEDDLVEQTCNILDITIPLDDTERLLKNNKGEAEIKISIGRLEYTVKYKWLNEEYSRVKGMKKYNPGRRIVLDASKEEEVRSCITLISEGGKIQKVLTVDASGKKVAVYYLPYIYEAERSVAASLLRIMSNRVNLPDMKLVDMYIKEYEKEQGIQLETMQKQAINNVFKYPLSVVSGSAGTGKSTIMGAVLYVTDKLYGRGSCSTILCAPTGKAAKRLSEATGGIEAKTVHRTLEFNSEGLFNYTKNNPLQCSLLIVDESSMLDILLSKSLFEAVGRNTTVVLIGDVQQLPSVGPGYVLGDVIRSGIIPTTLLNVIKRQKKGSGIAINASRILNGQSITTSPNGDFYVIHEEDSDRIAELLLKSYDKFMNKYGYPVSDIQIACLQNTGPLGTRLLNKRVQEMVNPAKQGRKEIRRGDTVFRVGDKVYHRCNNYNAIHYECIEGLYIKSQDKDGRIEKGIFNGDVGYVTDVLPPEENNDTGEDSVGMRLAVQYDNFYILYEEQDLDEIELAYCMTVHKLQGSASNIILGPVSYICYKLLKNNILYTLCTRSKSICCIIGEPNAIAYAIRTKDTDKRNTMLTELLKNREV